MAIKQTGDNRDFDAEEFIIDSEADLVDLPINVG